MATGCTIFAVGCGLIVTAKHYNINEMADAFGTAARRNSCVIELHMTDFIIGSWLPTFRYIEYNGKSCYEQANIRLTEEVIQDLDSGDYFLESMKESPVPAAPPPTPVDPEPALPTDIVPPLSPEPEN